MSVPCQLRSETLGAWAIVVFTVVRGQVIVEFVLSREYSRPLRTVSVRAFVHDGLLKSNERCYAEGLPIPDGCYGLMSSSGGVEPGAEHLAGAEKHCRGSTAITWNTE